MSFAIHQGTLALNTYTTQTTASNRLERSIEKLSSGLRINRAADDASGSAISEKLRRQVRGLSRAVQNAQDGVSTIQAAEGALSDTQDILQRMRELAGQASNDTLTSNDRLEIQKEIIQLRDNINSISYNTEFNTKKLLDGSQAAQIRSSSTHVVGITNGGAVKSGKYDVSIALVEAGVSQMQRSNILTVGETGELAVGSTQLQSIAQFTDANGAFALAAPQAILLSGNSRNASFTLAGGMTLDEVAATIQNALANDSGLGISGSNVGLVNLSQTKVADRGGYIQITSGMIGEKGDISFAGDQTVMNALGFSITRESQNNLVELSSRDAYGNLVQRRTSDDTASGLLGGVDVQFSSQPAQVAGLGGLETGLVLTGSLDSDFYIRVGESGPQRLIHAHQGSWSMEGLSRYINSQFQAFSMSGVKSSVMDGQIQITYDPELSSAASTIEISPRFPKQNAIGIPNGTFSGFVQCAKRAANTVYGFSRYATAAGTVRFSVSDGVDAATLSYTLITNRATPDLQNFSAWQNTQNRSLKNADVQVRVDAVNGSLTFTSLRVGNEITFSGGVTAGAVKVVLDATALTHGIDKKFGLAQQTTAVGTGDRNFSLFVASKSSQFQIGADTGQSMDVAISELSARALGVDNLDMCSVAGAQKSMTKLNKAIDRLASERSKLGSLQSRLESAVKSLSSFQNNTSSVESRLADTDAALEMVEFTRDRIVSESGTAMMAQANVMSRAIRQLLAQ